MGAEQDHGLLQLDHAVNQSAWPTQEGEFTVGFNEQQPCTSPVYPALLVHQERFGRINAGLQATTDGRFIAVTDGHHVTNNAVDVVGHGFKVPINIRLHGRLITRIFGRRTVDRGAC